MKKVSWAVRGRIRIIIERNQPVGLEGSLFRGYLFQASTEARLHAYSGKRHRSG